MKKVNFYIMPQEKVKRDKGIVQLQIIFQKQRFERVPAFLCEKINSPLDNVAKDYRIADAGTWIDGTYMETAKSKNGKFEVTVVIKDGNIASISIGNNAETPDKGGVAIAQLPEQIVAAQSYDVDVLDKISFCCKIVLKRTKGERNDSVKSVGTSKCCQGALFKMCGRSLCKA